MGLARDTANLMVGQYFKKRRDLVEIFLVSASGLGICIMSLLLRCFTRDIGWRLGLQVGDPGHNQHCRVQIFKLEPNEDMQITFCYSNIKSKVTFH